MKRLCFIIIPILLVLVIPPRALSQAPAPPVDLVEVINIVDGDTVDAQFRDGSVRRVRYIGINTPERDELCAAEATAANAALVAGKTVAMRRDVSQTDQYDRLLRYVYVGGLFVNAQLVIDGWAEAVRYPPDVTFGDWFDYLETVAVAANLGCHPTGVFGEADVQPSQPLEAGQSPPPPAATAATLTPAGPQFICDCSKACGDMASCEEAYFQLQQCGCSRRDGDGDGVPCESLCSGG